METLLQNSALLLATVTLLYVVIAGLPMTERMRVMLVYIFACFLALAGSFHLRYVCIGTTVVLLLALEFLSDDTARQQLFTRIDYKLEDFLYRMFVEYAYAYFCFAMAAIFIAHRWQHSTIVRGIALLVALVCLVLALVTLSAKRYATKSITDITWQLEGSMLTYQMTLTAQVQTLFEILAGMEDRTYFERAERQHTVPFMRFFAKGAAYLRAHKGGGVIRALRSLVSRGYGTIEMQLLRSIGIEFGYQYTIRRKLFELLYANLLFNGYRSYLVHGRGDYSHYRAFIIRKYIENVDVSVNGKKYRPHNGRSSLLRMFNKKHISNITKEEFFVWCLGLPQRAYIYPATLDYYSGLIYRFGIDRKVVERLLDSIK